MTVVALPAPAASTAWKLLGSWAYSGALVPSVSFTSLTNINRLMVECVELATDIAAAIEFLVSADNGVTFQAAGYRRVGTNGVRTLDAAGFFEVSAVTGTKNPWIIIDNWSAALNKIVSSACGAGFGTSQIVFAAALNAIKILPSNSGNFNAGTINVYGM